MIYSATGGVPQCKYKVAKTFYGELTHAPDADVAPVVHGQWQWKYPNGWACSECGEWGLMITNKGICKSSYCPNCGAKMDVEG